MPSVQLETYILTQTKLPVKLYDLLEVSVVVYSNLLVLALTNLPVVSIVCPLPNLTLNQSASAGFTASVACNSILPKNPFRSICTVWKPSLRP